MNKINKKNVQGTEKKKGRKVGVILALALLYSLTILVWVLIANHAPNPKTAPPENVIKFMASQNFSSWPRRDKEEYIGIFQEKNGTDFRKLMMDKSLSRTEQSNLRKNTRVAMQKEMKERMKKFFAMSKAEQDKMLDDMIKEREDRRKKDVASNGNARGPGAPGGFNASRMQSMLENTDSTTRAQMNEFHEKMRAREAQTANTNK